MGLFKKLKDILYDEEEYTFSKTGKITIKVLEEYLEKLEAEVRAVDSYEKPFGSEVLSDEYLGIPEVDE